MTETAKHKDAGLASRNLFAVIILLIAGMTIGGLTKYVVGNWPRSSSRKQSAADRHERTRKHVRQHVMRFLNEIADSGNLDFTEERATAVIDIHLEEFMQLHSLASKRYKMALKDLSSIIEAECAPLTKEELAALSTQSEQYRQTGEYPIPITIERGGDMYIVHTDLAEWDQLFERFHFGFGPRMALKSSVWEMFGQVNK